VYLCERERGREGERERGREGEREREREMGGHSFKKPNCKDHANLEKRRI
jgi:hypothetical protein